MLEPPTGIFGANLSQVMTLIHWLYCIVLYCIVLYCIVLYCIVLYRIVSYRIVSYRIVSCRVVSWRIVLYPLTPPGKERYVTKAIVYCVLRPCCKRDKRRAWPLKKNILRDSSQSAMWYRIHVDMISFVDVFGLLVLCSSNQAPREELPIMAYTGRLRPKGVPFQVSGIWKGNLSFRLVKGP